MEVYAAIDREGDIAVLVKETDMMRHAFVGVYAAIGDIAALVKETVDMVLQVDVLVVGFQWAGRKD